MCGSRLPVLLWRTPSFPPSLDSLDATRFVSSFFLPHNHQPTRKRKHDVNHHHRNMAQPTQRGLVPCRPTPSVTAGESRSTTEENNAKLWNSARFSDLLIKFSGREVKAHRLILCQAFAYFDKLCGPDSQFAVRLALLSNKSLHVSDINIAGSKQE